MTADALLTDEQTRQSDHRRNGGLSEYYDGITRVAKGDPAWGMNLLLALRNSGTRSGKMIDAVIRSYCQRLLVSSDFEEAITAVADPGNISASPALIATTIKQLVEKDPPGHIVNAITKIDALAAMLWSIVKDIGLDRDIPKDWLSAAINSAAGNLAEYVVSSISAQCRTEEGVRPPEISIELKSLLIDMIADPSINGGMCRPVIAAQCGYFFWLDQKMAEEHILPMFGSPNPATRSQSWQGFLTWGRLYPALARVMQPMFELMINGNHEELKDERNRFAEYLVLAGAMISDRCALEWMTNPGIHANHDMKLSVSRNSLNFLRDAPPEIVERHWKGWIVPYWRARIAGRPSRITDEEIAIFLDGLDDLESVFDEAVEILHGMPPATFQSTRILHGIQSKGIDARHPDATAKILKYLFACTRPHWCLHDADNVLRVISPLLSDTATRRELINVAIEQGAISSGDGLSLL